eukprot:352311-Chlamydomonas_euryale.AAC.4
MHAAGGQASLAEPADTACAGCSTAVGGKQLQFSRIMDPFPPPNRHQPAQVRLEGSKECRLRLMAMVGQAVAPLDSLARPGQGASCGLQLALSPGRPPASHALATAEGACRPCRRSSLPSHTAALPARCPRPRLHTRGGGAPGARRTPRRHWPRRCIM